METRDLTTTTGDLIENQALDQNAAAVYLAGLGASSRRTTKAALDTIADLLASGSDAFSFPWGAVRFQHVNAVRSELQERFAPSTANRHISALRGALKAAWRLGQMTAEDYHRAADVEAIKGETVPAGRSITPGELQAMVNACLADSTAAGDRDAALLGILYYAGLRRAELVALALGDYDPETGALVVRGKGHKERVCYVVNGAAEALADWLAVRGDWPGPLFVSILKGGHVQAERMTPQAVYFILHGRADQAGVKELSPHDFRRTFVGDLLDAGADIVTVQKLAGHANVTTTARYDRRPEVAKRKAVGLLHFPYTRRRAEG